MSQHPHDPHGKPHAETPVDDQDMTITPDVPADPTPEPEPEAIVETPVAEAAPETDDDISVTPRESDDPDAAGAAENPPDLDPKLIPLYGCDVSALADIYNGRMAKMGVEKFTKSVYTAGSYDNLLHNLLATVHAEAERERSVFEAMSEVERAGTVPRYIDPTTGRVVMAAANVVSRPTEGTTKMVSGKAAISAIMNVDKGGSIRVPLYNSGIAIDLLIPDNRELEDFMTACEEQDQRFGTMLGANYFAFSDQLYKARAIAFIQPLITGTSMQNWEKGNNLWTTVRLPDYIAILAWLAHIANIDGYTNFIDFCTRPVDAQHPEGCDWHEEKRIVISDMIRTRFPVMPKEAIDHMIAAIKTPGICHTEAQVKAYQAQFNFDGEVIEHEDALLTMKIPTVAEHLITGAQFLADIVNEVSADNTAGGYERMGFRYMTILGSWVQALERRANGGGVKTEEREAINRYLEVLDDRDFKLKRPDDESCRGKLDAFIKKVQLTYIGYAAAPCPKCGYVPDTASGMKTIEPFTTFFTGAFARLMNRS